MSVMATLSSESEDPPEDSNNGKFQMDHDINTFTIWTDSDSNHSISIPRRYYRTMQIEIESLRMENNRLRETVDILHCPYDGQSIRSLGLKDLKALDLKLKMDKNLVQQQLAYVYENRMNNPSTSYNTGW